MRPKWMKKREEKERPEVVKAEVRATVESSPRALIRDNLLMLGDCVEMMRSLPAESVHSVVCDPPYNLAFMGRKWDAVGTPREFQQWTQRWAEQAMRVLKPGGHALVMGGTRTFHRTASGLEDAGFEIRDCMMWLYGTGFPKSLNVGKAIDKAAGAKREVIGQANPFRDGGKRRTAEKESGVDFVTEKHLKGGMVDVTAPATEAAAQWEGWGTALKPAWEPIIVARKPFKGTVAANVQKHSTGGLNIDASRVTTDENLDGGAYAKDGSERHDGTENWRYKREGGAGEYEQPEGRWPANLILDEEASAMLDEQSGITKSTGGSGGSTDGWVLSGEGSSARVNSANVGGLGDTGGASRFFYCAKPSKAERSMDGTVENKHVTVKPIRLMEYLVRLVTPPDGTVLDPFMGSGTTLLACERLGFAAIGIEIEQESFDTAAARLQHEVDSRGSEE